jgi:hypothetical protein
MWSKDAEQRKMVVPKGLKEAPAGTTGNKDTEKM